MHLLHPASTNYQLLLYDFDLQSQFAIFSIHGDYCLYTLNIFLKDSLLKKSAIFFKKSGQHDLY